MLIFMLILNLGIQLLLVFFGVAGGIILRWLAAEELSLYASKILFIQKTLFILTFISALFFSSNIFLISFLALSYGIIAFPQRNELQIFYYITPLVLFLSTETQEGFFLTSALLFLATILSVTVAQEVLFSDLWGLLRQWQGFFIVTIILYGIIYVIGL